MVIFVSSIGRSGTRFIANLFDACTNVPAFHAKEPHCHGENILPICNGETTSDLSTKLAIIEESAREKGSYFESTQLFNRILSESILEKFDDVRVIHLLRDPLEVAKSYINRDSHPGRDDRPWRVPLNTPRAGFQFPADDLTPFQLNLCDWLDNELRFNAIAPRLTKTAILQFSDFGNSDAIATLFRELEVEFDPEKLVHHLSSGEKLDKNANKTETVLEAKDFEEANQLIKRLNCLNFPTTDLQASHFSDFPFVVALRENAPLKRPGIFNWLSGIFKK